MPFRSGSGIQIPTRPSRARSSSVVMSTVISVRGRFIPVPLTSFAVNCVDQANRCTRRESAKANVKFR